MTSKFTDCLVEDVIRLGMEMCVVILWPMKERVEGVGARWRRCKFGEGILAYHCMPGVSI